VNTALKATSNTSELICHDVET